MQSEKSTMRTEAIFSDCEKYRYLLLKEWDIKKPKATVIMINPSNADAVEFDYTTLYIVNNLYRIGFGGAYITNICPIISTKIEGKDIMDFPDEIYDENLSYITKAAEKSEKIIIAWGRGNNKHVQVLQNEVLSHLKPYEGKFHIILDKHGREGFHPLAPCIRDNWILKKLDIKDSNEDK